MLQLGVNTTKNAGWKLECIPTIVFFPPARFQIIVARVPQASYLDYNATTAIDPDVLQSMLPFWTDHYGNPSSIHSIGRLARGWLDEARTRTAELWKCKPHEVVFTSGGTESNNLAVLGTARKLKARGNHLVTSPTEHPAVLESFRNLEQQEGFEVTWLPVDGWGRVAPRHVQGALRPNTILVSLMAANNETGVLQPVSEVAAICRAAGVLFHTDAVQYFGKEPFASMTQFGADLVSVCAHKFHGPKGVGALYVRSPFHPCPTQMGGPQENELRAGTENLASVWGLLTAMEKFWTPPVFQNSRNAHFQAILRSCLDQILEVRVWTPSSGFLSNTLSFSASGTDSLALLAALDLEGFCASSGSACSAGSLTPSHVLKAMGVESELANALVRFSWGRDTAADEIHRLADRLPRMVEQVRSGRRENVVNKARIVGEPETEN